MTTAKDWNPDQEQRASLALNELAAARDAILSACELLGVTPDALGLGRALEDLAAVLAVADRRQTTRDSPPACRPQGRGSSGVMGWPPSGPRRILHV